MAYAIKSEENSAGGSHGGYVSDHPDVFEFVKQNSAKRRLPKSYFKSICSYGCASLPK
ncbi:MAG: hypothetical protein ACLUKN_09290 [Bacilli bacterium]